MNEKFTVIPSSNENKMCSDNKCNTNSEPDSHCNPSYVISDCYPFCYKITINYYKINIYFNILYIYYGADTYIIYSLIIY